MTNMITLHKAHTYNFFKYEPENNLKFSAISRVLFLKPSEDMHCTEQRN